MKKTINLNTPKYRVATNGEIFRIEYSVVETDFFDIFTFKRWYPYCSDDNDKEYYDTLVEAQKIVDKLELDYKRRHDNWGPVVK